MTLIPSHKLRNHQNRRITKGLFNEFHFDERFNFFTLKRWDTNPCKGSPDGLVSFPKTYLHYAVQDPTEYLFATEVFGDWEHWQLVANMEIMGDIMNSLRAERDVAIRSIGFQHIAGETKDKTSKNAYAAAKWLAEKGWDATPKEGAVSARRTKAAKAQETEEEKAAIDLAKSLSDQIGISLN